MGKWEMVRLGDVCVIERGGSPRPIDKFITEDESGINWIKIGDTSPNSMYITATKEKIKPEGVKKSRRVYSGDFLLSNSMSFGRPYILKIDGCIHDGWLLIRDEQQIFDKRFLYYYLGSDRIYAEFESLAVGGVVNNLNSGMVREIKIPLLSLSVQQQIADVLDRASALIEKRKAQIDKLDLLVKSQFIKMFGDPVTNPKGWEQTSIGETCYYVKDGPHVSPKYVEYGTGVPFISTRNLVGSSGIDWSTAKYISEADYELYSQKCKPEKGDMLYTKGGTTGIARYVNTDMRFANWVHVAVLKYKENLNGIFFENMLNSDYCYYQSQLLTKGIANRDLVLSAMKQIKFYLPPLSLQNQFADFVKQVDAQKSLLQQSLAQLEQNYKSLMQKCFRGEVF